jgi:hypothetical protein
MKMDGGIQYVSTIKIGMPPRSLNFVIDTGSSDILVLLKNQHKTLKQEMLAEKSSSFKHTGSFDIKYGAGKCSGIKGSDVMTIGGYSLTGEEIGFANIEDYVVTTINADGVLGLALVGLSKITRPPFMAQLMQEHEDSLQNLFSIFIEPRFSGPKNMLFIGGFDISLAGPGAVMNYLPLMHTPGYDEYTYWAFAVDKVSFAWKDGTRYRLPTIYPLSFHYLPTIFPLSIHYLYSISISTIHYLARPCARTTIRCPSSPRDRNSSPKVCRHQ